MILEELGPSAKALKSCSLTCRRWHSRSTKLLFASYRIHIRNDSPEHVHAMETIERVNVNIVNLRIGVRSQAHLKLIQALPQLRELIITSFHVYGDTDLANGIYAALPRRTPVDRTLAFRKIREEQVWVVEWLLQLFASVDKRILRWIHLWPEEEATIHTAKYVVNAPELESVNEQALCWLQEFLGISTLRRLAIHARAPYIDHNACVEAMDTSYRQSGPICNLFII